MPEMTPEQKALELEADLTDAENAITEAGYSGFCQGRWYCVGHALKRIWKSDLDKIAKIVVFCETGEGDMTDPDGSMVYAWNDNYQSDYTIAPGGISCSVKGCKNEIHPSEDGE